MRRQKAKFLVMVVLGPCVVLTTVKITIVAKRLMTDKEERTTVNTSKPIDFPWS